MRRCLRLTLAAVLLTACAPGTAAPPDEDAEAAPADRGWTDEEQEVVAVFGQERAQRTLVAARDFADECPDGDFSVLPTDAPVSGGGSSEAPRIEDSTALGFTDLVVAVEGLAVVATPTPDEGGTTATLTATVTDVLWSADDVTATVSPGDEVTARIPRFQPCDVPASGHVLFAVHDVDGQVELSTVLVTDDESRPVPVSRWLLAAVVPDIADVGERNLDIPVLLQLVEEGREALDDQAGSGCVREEGTCPATPGLLGRWRVQRGHEPAPDGAVVGP